MFHMFKALHMHIVRRGSRDRRQLQQDREQVWVLLIYWLGACRGKNCYRHLARRWRLKINICQLVSFTNVESTNRHMSCRKKVAYSVHNSLSPTSDSEHTPTPGTNTPPNESESSYASNFPYHEAKLADSRFGCSLDDPQCKEMILVMGRCGAGKSSFINTLVGALVAEIGDGNTAFKYMCTMSNPEFS